jgi:hypothetical protein
MEANRIKIQKAILPAGAGIVALGSAVKVLLLVAVGIIVFVFGLKHYRRRRADIAGKRP